METADYPAQADGVKFAELSEDRGGTSEACAAGVVIGTGNRRSVGEGWDRFDRLAALVGGGGHFIFPTQRFLHLTPRFGVAVCHAHASEHVHLTDLAIDGVGRCAS